MDLVVLWDLLDPAVKLRNEKYNSGRFSSKVVVNGMRKLITSHFACDPLALPAFDFDFDTEQFSSSSLCGCIRPCHPAMPRHLAANSFRMLPTCPLSSAHARVAAMHGVTGSVVFDISCSALVVRLCKASE